MIKQKTIKPLVDYIKQQQPISAHDISKGLNLSRKTIHMYLKVALDQQLIVKHGSVPHVLYTGVTNNLSTSHIENKIVLTYNAQQFLNQHFLVYDVTGQELLGYDGFIIRCYQRSLDPEEQYKSFQVMVSNIDILRDPCGLINKGYIKFKKQVEKSHIEDLYYCDIYQLAHFGKSRLGSLSFYAKQSQSLALLNSLGNITKPQIRCHIQSREYDAICYIPPSLKRSVQILDKLKSIWDIDLPELKLKKLYTGPVIIPQKSIKGTKQRIRNARETIFLLPNQKKYNHVLLIDDFVGSGATINESASKIKNAGLAKKVTGLALVGNIDLDYEVINEV